MKTLVQWLADAAYQRERNQRVMDWHIRAHVEGGIPLPSMATETWCSVNQYDSGWQVDPEKTLDVLAQIVQFCSTVEGCKVEKKYDSSDFNLYVHFDDREMSDIHYYARRESVCVRKVVGTKRVEEKVIEAHDEEIVEWECEPVSLLARNLDEMRHHPEEREV